MKNTITKNIFKTLLIGGLTVTATLPIAKLDSNSQPNNSSNSTISSNVFTSSNSKYKFNDSVWVNDMLTFPYNNCLEMANNTHSDMNYSYNGQIGSDEYHLYTSMGDWNFGWNHDNYWTSNFIVLETPLSHQENESVYTVVTTHLKDHNNLIQTVYFTIAKSKQLDLFTTTPFTIIFSSKIWASSHDVKNYSADAINWHSRIVFNEDANNNVQILWNGNDLIFNEGNL